MKGGSSNNIIWRRERRKTPVSVLEALRSWRYAKVQPTPAVQRAQSRSAVKLVLTTGACMVAMLLLVVPLLTLEADARGGGGGGGGHGGGEHGGGGHGGGGHGGGGHGGGGHVSGGHAGGISSGGFHSGSFHSAPTGGFHGTSAGAYRGGYGGHGGSGGRSLTGYKGGDCRG